MTESLETEVQRILDSEVEHLIKGASPPSCAYFFTTNGKLVADTFDFKDKTKARKLLKKAAKKYKATMVVTVSKALISKLEGTPANPTYFNRDVLFAYGESKTHNYGLAKEYERMSNGEIIIGKEVEFPDGRSQGLMTGFMCRKYWL